MRPLLFCSTLFLVLLTPGASAFTLDHAYTSDAPSGAYLDFTTDTAYQYDANTGILTPDSSLTTTPTAYACVDAVPRGQTPSLTCTTNNGGVCAAAYKVCGAAFVAGALVSSVNVIYAVHDNCLGDWGTGVDYGSAGVAYYRGRADFGGLDCGGTLTVTVKVNGRIIDSDTASW